MNKLLKTFLVLLFTLLGTNNSFSQSLVWEKVVGKPNLEERCFTSARLSPSLYVFGGYYYNGSTTILGPYLIFTNAMGDSLYSRRYPQFNEGIIYGIAANPDGSMIAIGSYFDQAAQQGAFFGFKTDSVGNIIWQKTNLNIKVGGKLKVLSIPDGYLLASNGYLSDDLFKIDKQGNLLWKKSYGIDTEFMNINLMKDGSYLACGNTLDKSPASLGAYHQLNPMLLQLKPNGDTIRTKVLGSFQNHDLVHEAKQTADGGVIVAGRYVLNSNPTKMQGLVMKFDSAWNQQWWYTIMPPYGAYDRGCELFNVQQLADSSYIVSGNFSEPLGAPSPYGESNGYVANIAKDGSAIIWQQQYKRNNANAETFSSIFYLNDGSAVFSGIKAMTSPDIDFYLVKLKNLGLPYVPNYCQQKPLPRLSVQVITNDTIAFTSNSFAGTRYGSISTYLWRFGDGTTSVLPNPKRKYNMPLSALQNIPVTLIVTNNSGCTDSITTYPFLRVSAPDALPGLQVQLYPNPASGKATFTISGNTNKEAVRIELTDVLGRKLNVPVKQSQQNENQQLEVNTATLPTGLYIYRLYSGSQLLSTGKLVKE